jgi:cytochrome c
MFTVGNYSSPYLHPTKCYESGIFVTILGSTRWGPVHMIRTRTLVAAVTLVTATIVTARQEKQGDSIPDGQKLFQQCSGCHSAETSERKVGPSLKGLFKKSVLLNGLPANERSIRLRIQNGGDGMPSYGRILSPKELDRLVVYLKTL